MLPFQINPQNVNIAKTVRAQRSHLKESFNIKKSTIFENLQISYNIAFTRFRHHFARLFLNHYIISALNIPWYFFLTIGTKLVELLMLRFAKFSQYSGPKFPSFTACRVVTLSEITQCSLHFDQRRQFLHLSISPSVEDGNHVERRNAFSGFFEHFK